MISREGGDERGGAGPDTAQDPDPDTREELAKLLDGWKQAGPGRFTVADGELRSEGGMGLDPGADRDAVEEELAALPGIGPGT
ncbi:hypothetical protein ACWDR0_08930, partial [Streptomyces sp. NPDC003691]